MSTFSIISAACAIVMVVLAFRRERREAQTRSAGPLEQIRILRNRTQSDVVEELFYRLIPIRGLYLHLSRDDRLRMELELIFREPNTDRTISDIYYRQYRFESGYRLSRIIRYARDCSALVGFVSLTVILLPGVKLDINSPLSSDLVACITMAVFLESIMAVIMLTICKTMLDRRLVNLINLVQP